MYSTCSRDRPLFYQLTHIVINVAANHHDHKNDIFCGGVCDACTNFFYPETVSPVNHVAIRKC